MNCVFRILVKIIFSSQQISGSEAEIKVEGEPTGILSSAEEAEFLKLGQFLGKRFAIAKELDPSRYPLPVMARNKVG